AAMEKVDRGGSTVGTLPAETGLARLELVYSATGWMLLGGNDVDEASA
ncbi:MAG: hypothetical protein JWP95_1417, partial [Actinotalea sp.]|nr:hypothetical protein [Actinotalea sp.]